MLKGDDIMKFELVEIKSRHNKLKANCFPDFFDDCNPTDDACIPTEMNDEDEN